MPLQTYPRLIAIVGRPNVGKSTLFNRIIRERKSLVHDEPGVTRDRIFGRGEFEGKSFYICDTGGFEPTSKDNIKKQLVEQAKLAIEEAEVVIFATDGREGLHPIDKELIRELRKAEKKFVVAVNKCDTPSVDYLSEDFRPLGVKHIFPVSAEHGRGIGDLLSHVTSELKGGGKLVDPSSKAIKIALVGRPNVGKSSILNRLVGEERSIVDSKPGTTRDTVDALVKYHGNEFLVLDTAGIQQRARMVDKMEKFSAFRSLMNLEEADLSILIIDADEGPTEGDLRVAGYAFELRKPILIVVNKWDLKQDKKSGDAEKYKEKVYSALKYIPYAPILFTSAVENQRISKILPMCLELFEESSKKISTGKLNKALKEILVKHTPPLTKTRSRRIKFFYITQVGKLPPRFIIFCSHPEDIHFSYKRFLENSLRQAFEYTHVPIAIVFRERTRTKMDDDFEVKTRPTRSLSRFEREPDIFDIEWDDED